jgi:hypothetical protein
MTPQTKRRLIIAVWTLAGLLVLVPVSLFLIASPGFRHHSIAQQHEATRLVAEFHQRYNAHDFEGICREAFKCSESPNVREGWQLVLQDTRNRGGSFRDVVRSDIQVTTEPPSVRADVVSSFEKGQIREIFTMNDFDGTLKIASYNLVFAP